MGTIFTSFTKDGIGGTEIWEFTLKKSGIIWITTRKLHQDMIQQLKILLHSLYLQQMMD